MFGVLYAAEGSDVDALAGAAREFSPRIEQYGEREIVLDLSGLTRLFGDARSIGEELRRTAADRGLRVRVAIAGTSTAARLLVRSRAGLTIAAPGDEPHALAPLPIVLLAAVACAAGDEQGVCDTLRRWGLRTLGDVAALPADEVSARLGHTGVQWQRVARGEDARPLVPSMPEERFEEALDLEWPIDGLEPLSFVLGRLLEPLSARLERRGRGAAVLHVRLRLTTREVHERSLQLPAPMRDAKTLRTLALLDLESHPPRAAIDRVVVAIDPTPGRIVQFSLLTRPLPSPEQVSTLIARLNALMGEGRCGSPAMVDTWEPGAFAMQPFAPKDSPQEVVQADAVATPAVALRRFRFPVPARVWLEDGRPGRVTTDRRGLGGGRVEACAGPWRTSGGWWMDSPAAHTWNRDEWDVMLADGATYRLFRERAGDRWFVEGILD